MDDTRMCCGLYSITLRASGIFLLLALILILTGCKDKSTTTQEQSELPATRINKKDNAEMVLIPAGEFQRGISEEKVPSWLERRVGDKRTYTKALPERLVYLDAYYMYKSEVTVEQYRMFCRKTRRKMPSAPNGGWIDNHPIVNVSWEDAAAYSKWAGASLPTEAQWEKAARGGDGRLLPWGNNWPPPKGAGNFADMTAKQQFPNWTLIIDGYQDGYPELAPVGSFTANPYGLYDLEGNASEWCADWYDPYYLTTAPTKNPTGPASGNWRMARGGSYNSSDPQGFLVTYREQSTPTSGGTNNLGFRCVVLPRH
ncbi:MAG: formylglycine-generating enzyme family protein [Armatimonadota bacterium]